MVVSKATARDRINASMRKEGKRLVGRSTAKAMHQEILASQKEQVIVCENCHKSQESLGGGLPVYALQPM
jgi:arginine/lysine/ornithine decarboxylase